MEVAADSASFSLTEVAADLASLSLTEVAADSASLSLTEVAAYSASFSLTEVSAYSTSLSLTEVAVYSASLLLTEAAAGSASLSLRSMQIQPEFLYISPYRFIPCISPCMFICAMAAVHFFNTLLNFLKPKIKLENIGENIILRIFNLQFTSTKVSLFINKVLI